MSDRAVNTLIERYKFGREIAEAYVSYVFGLFRESEKENCYRKISDERKLIL
jgi:hypothetical protein